MSCYDFIFYVSKLEQRKSIKYYLARLKFIYKNFQDNDNHRILPDIFTMLFSLRCHTFKSSQYYLRYICCMLVSLCWKRRIIPVLSKFFNVLHNDSCIMQCHSYSDARTFRMVLPDRSNC